MNPYRTRSFLRSLYDNMVRNTEYLTPRFGWFGSIAAIGFPLYYVVWHYLFPQPYENLPLRLLGSALFVPIILAKRWPSAWKKHLPLYWHGALLFALPFFFTFMLLHNQNTSAWLLSALAAMFLMVTLLDWRNLLVQTCLGVAAAWGAYLLTAPRIDHGMLQLESTPIYLFVLIFGAVANYTAEAVRLERMRTLRSAASAIAHELRTPLLSIKAGAAGLRQHIPALLDSYRLAKEAELPVPLIRESHRDALANVLRRIEDEVNHSNIVIDMLLVNSKLSDIHTAERELYLMSDTVRKALDRYPFGLGKTSQLVRTEIVEDFRYRGHDLLIMHLIFNLLKNALRHIGMAGKGDILIRLENSKDGGRLVFRDTGPGIPPAVLPHIFTRFFSWPGTHKDGSGSGIGLAFCKSVMEAFDGSISCQSKLGEFTEFVLTFPKVND